MCLVPIHFCLAISKNLLTVSWGIIAKMKKADTQNLLSRFKALTQ